MRWVPSPGFTLIRSNVLYDQILCYHLSCGLYHCASINGCSFLLCNIILLHDSAHMHLQHYFWLGNYWWRILSSCGSNFHLVSAGKCQRRLVCVSSHASPSKCTSSSVSKRRLICNLTSSSSIDNAFLHDSTSASSAKVLVMKCSLPSSAFAIANV